MKSRIRALRRVALPSRKVVVIFVPAVLVMGLAMIFWAGEAPLAASVLVGIAVVGIGFFVGLFVVRRSTRLRTADDVKRRLGLPVLATYVRPLDEREDE